jgi:4a-hydroxytetrahydrobiopterin dehydratase
MSKKTILKFLKEDITKNIKKIDGWTVKDDLSSIYKIFIFKGFKEAFSWMTLVSIEAEKLNHHPNWSNIYNKVEVNLSTHDISGLSKKDFLMANYMDQKFMSEK